MTPKEIFALRKEGRLDEAYAEAKKALAVQADDAWMIKALAWVLYDMIKMEMKAKGSKVQSLLDEFNALPLGNDDEILAKQKVFLNQISDPIKISIHELTAKSKAGQHEEALEGFRELCQKNPDNHQVDSGYGWALFRRLYHLPPEHQKAPIIGGLLRDYARLTVEKPGLVHSCLLKATLHQAEHYDKLVEFILWWNPDHLRSEDYEIEKDEQGNEYPSLYVRMIRAIGKSLKKRNDLNRDTIVNLLPLFEAAIKRCPDEEWFPYYHGQLLIQTGNLDQARVELMPLIKIKQRAFWAWDLLAQLCGNPGDQCACLCKALTCKVPDEGFLVKIHVELAECLLKLGRPDEARTEIECVLRIRAKRGWRITQEIQQLAQDLQAQPDRADMFNNEAFYKRYENRALELLLGDEPSVIGVVTRVNKQKGLSCIQFGKERTDFTLVYHDKYPDMPILFEEGAVFSMKLNHDKEHQRHSALTVAPSTETPDSAFFRNVEGSVRKSESQPFAFLGDVFISPPFVSMYQLGNGQPIKANAVLEWNDKKAAFTWRVIEVCT